MLEVAIFCYSFALHLLLILLSHLLYLKFDRRKRPILVLATAFSNCGFIGYPVALSLFGSQGVLYTSIFCIPFNLLMYSYGVMSFTGRPSLKSVGQSLFNAPQICTAVGLVIFLFSIPLPSAVVATLETVGAMTTPLSMFVIGAMLADMPVRDVMRGADVYYLSVMKLIVAPGVAYAVLRALGGEPTIVAICVVLIAMPSASMVGVFAERYDGNRRAASRCVFVTTVLSVITIPGILAFL
jgi:predicted permease